MKERDIQKLIMDYLAAEHILAFRMNVGAMKIDKRFIQYGVLGMADILSFPLTGVPLWIEVKAEKGKQSPAQKSFRDQVEEYGHHYLLARSLDDVQTAVRIL
jgi:hypothetical protein